MIDVLEWFGLVVNVTGLVFISLVIAKLYDYRRASRLPSPTNGRRGHFAAILLLFGRVSIVWQSLLLLISVVALRTSNVQTDRATAYYVIFTMFSLTLTLGWAYIYGHLRAIRRYASRLSDVRDREQSA
jgi:hypothetical protein